MQNKHQITEQFYQMKKQRQTFFLSTKLVVTLSYCQYIIEKKLVKNKKTTRNKHDNQDKSVLSIQFRQAFKTLNLQEMIAYYTNHIDIIRQLLKSNIIQKLTLPQGMLFDYAYIRSFSLKIWRQKNLRLNRQQKMLYAEYDQQIKAYALSDYLLRISKNTDYHSFVLEAISKNIAQKQQTIHIGFKEVNKFKIWYKQLMEIYRVIHWQHVYSELKSILQVRHYIEEERQTGWNKKQKQFFTPTKSELFDQYSHLTQSYKKQRVIQRAEEDLSRSVIVDKQQKTRVLGIDTTQFYEIQQSNPSNIGFTSLHSITNDAQNYSATRQQFIKQLQEIRQCSQQMYNQQIKGPETLIESIAHIDTEQVENIERNDENIDKYEKMNIFQKLFPSYQLSQIENTTNMKVLSRSSQFSVMQNCDNPLKIKMFYKFQPQFSLTQILIALSNPQITKLLNTQIQSSSLKTMIKSENSALIYTKIKPYNRLYRARDFVYLRHVFRDSDTYYIADKSIESINYPPFTTIVRGQLTCIWSIRQQELEKNSIIVTCDTIVHNNGYLDKTQNANLTIKYFQAYEGLITRIKAIKQGILQVFMPDWDISSLNNPKKQELSSPTKKQKQQSPQKSIKPKSTSSIKQQAKVNVMKTPPKNKSQKSSDAEQTVKQIIFNSKQKESIRLEENDEEGGQILLEEYLQTERIKQQIKTVSEIKREFDQKGQVIIFQDFIKAKYSLEPEDKDQTKFAEAVNGHPIWKGEWRHDDQEGSIVFINEKKIEDQKGVLKFILKNIGKNLLSGKSILNISLPVDIFSAQSNLELFMKSLAFAPVKLEPVINCYSSLEKFKAVIGFGISNSPLYLNMEKPFNPILGQTFQCYLDGCPGYAQQISHHPPIAALYFCGRGYTISAQLQSKIQLHMNSGCGYNDGIFNVDFDDGVQISYITPGGEVSGLTYGDRKFNMVGKSYYWIEKQGIFLQIIFNPTQKGFFSMSKQVKPIDYFQGTIYKVKAQFLKKFMKKKKGCPEEKDIIEKIGKIHGIWNKKIMFDHQTILDLDKEYPVKLEYEASPLPSDSNWREDIAYRRLLLITRAQEEKERLEILQRKDRKLREKRNK